MTNRINVKEFRQSPNYCGPASVIIAASAFGVHATEEQLAGVAGTQDGEGPREGGTEHEGMTAAGKSLGFSVFTKEEGTIDDLIYFIEKEHLPVIVGWFDTDGDHYSVAIEITDAEVIMADPSSLGPERRISRELFPNIWFDFVGNGSHKVSWGWLMVMTKEKREFANQGGTHH